MLAELFARRDNALDYNRNPMDKFLVSIKYEEYVPNETLQTIGVYRGLYTIFFSPGNRGCPAMCISLVGHANPGL